jgi:hypothetical protein
MRERRRATIEDLRRAVVCLPRATRIAMLEGIESNEIIVGAYSDDDGPADDLARRGHRARAHGHLTRPGGARRRAPLDGIATLAR